MEDSGAPGRIPRIHRARGFRLYDMDGNRLLDLHRDGALLGHRAAASITIMKNVLSQGLATGVPSAWERRLTGAITRLYPSHPFVRLYSSAEWALAAAGLYLGEPIGWGDVMDPALCDDPSAAAGAALARPFLPVPNATVLLPLLPLTICGAPAPACFPEEPPDDVPGSDPLPGFLLAGALRAAAALLPGQEGAAPALAGPAVERAVDGSRAWARRGPYVRAVFDADDWPRVYAEFLRAGVILGPAYPGPSVLPGECSPGETRLLVDLFTGVPGG